MPRLRSIRVLAPPAILGWFVFGIVLTSMAPSSAFIAAALAGPAGRWIDVSAEYPLARSDAAQAFDTLRRRLIVFGGTAANDISSPDFMLNDLWVLDLTTQGWSPINPEGIPPPPCYGASAIYDAAHDRLVVFGGMTRVNVNDPPHGSQGVYALSLAGVPTWSHILPASTWPEARGLHVAGYDGANDRMILFGGWNGTTFLNDTWELTLGDDPTWTQLSPSGSVPPARNLAGAAVDPSGSRMFLYGGWDGTNRSDTWSLSLSGDPNWTEITTATSPPGRQEVSVAWDSDHNTLALFGGYYANISHADLWALDMSGTPDWHQISPAAGPSRRDGHASVYDPVSRRLLIFGGRDNTVFRSDAWAISMSGPSEWELQARPEDRLRNYTAQFDPVAHEMVIFGGEKLALTNEVHSFPLTGLPSVWTLEQPTGVKPSPRHASCSIWDPVRDRMLIFGGYDLNYQNDVWAYQPRPTPSWTQLITNGAPPLVRLGSAAIYDAPHDRMLIFGGFDADAFPYYYNDTWELPLSGPNALTWHQLTPTGALPDPRYSHIFVVDPARQRAFVFGGTVNSISPLSDLWTLDLSVDPPVWNRPTFGPPAPSRFAHTGVVDPINDRLVVFGGWDGSVEHNEVFALPLTGPPTWTQLSPGGGTLPNPRGSMSAVYDPDHKAMTVFGGTNGSTLYNDTWTLSWDNPTTAVDPVVPIASGLALAGAQPNPSLGGALRVAFSLERKGPARLDLIDVAGRRVASRDLSTLDAGRHVISVAGEGQLAPGLYLIKLTAGDRSLTAKAFVVR